MRAQPPTFDAALPSDLVIWRYLDLPKFLAMMNERGLFFARAETLGDPLEGSLTDANITEVNDRYTSERFSSDEIQWFEKLRTQATTAGPKTAYVNCWHIGAHESMAMWQGYGGGPYGVAIRSQFGTFETVLPTEYDGNSIYIGRVNYLDFEREKVPRPRHVFSALLCKSAPYAHESELRAVFVNPWTINAIGWLQGFTVPVALSALVHEVVISPLAPSWFTDVVHSASRRFGYDWPVVQSRNRRAPVY
jgi:hypothetical protein